MLIFANVKLNETTMKTRIIKYQRRKCGAVTLYFGNGANNSMYEKTRKKLGIDLRGVERMENAYACNHCVNHWGIDLCECGSGDEVGKCECGANKSVPTLGEVYDSFGKMLENLL